jgi:hypothetical protein
MMDTYPIASECQLGGSDGFDCSQTVSFLYGGSQLDFTFEFDGAQTHDTRDLNKPINL